MSSQISSVAQQVRIQQWADLIRDCQNRPCEMTLDTWCLLHGTNKATYYYHLRKVRQACLNVITPTKPVFVELSLLLSMGHHLKYRVYQLRWYC